MSDWLGWLRQEWYFNDNDTIESDEAQFKNLFPASFPLIVRQRGDVLDQCAKIVSGFSLLKYHAGLGQADQVDLMLVGLAERFVRKPGALGGGYFRA